MKSETLIIAIVALLVLVSAVQAVQLFSLQGKTGIATTTVNSAASQEQSVQTPQNIPAALRSLPNQVGGC